MSSFFKGLGDVYNPKSPVPVATPQKYTFEKVRHGQVLDVVYDQDSPYYGTDGGIGVIRFRHVYEDYNKPEEAIQLFAFPLDRTNYTLPLPGEQVLIYPILVGQSILFAYGQIVQHDFNSVYNVHPLLSTDSKYINPDVLQALINVEVTSQRFKKKLYIPYEVYENASRTATNIREGDTIIQGRFGSMVRFTSTMEEVVNKSMNKDMSIGVDVLGKSFSTGDGDPVLVLQANRVDLKSLEQHGVTDLDINNIDSCVYLTSTQTMPMQLACSKNLYTWSVEAMAGSPKKAVDEDTAALSKLFPDGYNPNDTFTINLGLTATGATPFEAGNLGTGDKASNIKLLIQALSEVGITNPNAQYGFLGCVGKECGFIPKSEYGYGSTSNGSLRKLFGARIKQFLDPELETLKKKNEEFYDYIYGYKANIDWNTGNDQPGDGWKYRGRGFNQITFKSSYRKYGDLIGVDLVSNPDQLNNPAVAARAAIQFFINGFKKDIVKNARGTTNPNEFSTVEDAIYWYVRVNHGGSMPLQENFTRATAIVRELQSQYALQT
jgi:predicted chitinase